MRTNAQFTKTVRAIAYCNGLKFWDNAYSEVRTKYKARRIKMVLCNHPRATNVQLNEIRNEVMALLVESNVTFSSVTWKIYENHVELDGRYLEIFVSLTKQNPKGLIRVPSRFECYRDELSRKKIVAMRSVRENLDRMKRFEDFIKTPSLECVALALGLDLTVEFKREPSNIFAHDTGLIQLRYSPKLRGKKKKLIPPYTPRD